MDIFQYARQLRRTSTKAEIILWAHLRNRNLLGFKFRRQSVIEYRFIADFYCPAKKLIIEVDGKIHLKREVKLNDRVREKELIGLGYQVIRFTNEEVLNDLNFVLDSLKDYLKT